MRIAMKAAHLDDTHRAGLGSHTHRVSGFTDGDEYPQLYIAPGRNQRVRNAILSNTRFPSPPSSTTRWSPWEPTASRRPSWQPRCQRLTTTSPCGQSNSVTASRSTVRTLMPTTSSPPTVRYSTRKPLTSARGLPTHHRDRSNRPVHGDITLSAPYAAFPC